MRTYEVIIYKKGILKMTKEAYLSWPEVKRITGNKSRTTITRWMREGYFPRNYKIGLNSVAWKESEIQAWVESKNKPQPHLS